MKTVYGAENCPKCHKLKDKLTKQGESFKYIDISALNKDEIEQLIEKANSTSLPIILVE